MRCHPDRRVNHTQSTIFCTQKTGPERPPHAGYVVRIDPLACTGGVKRLYMLMWATGHAPNAQAPPI
jgi:hypothetical protein